MSSYNSSKTNNIHSMSFQHTPGAQWLGSSAPKGVKGKRKCSLRIEHLP